MNSVRVSRRVKVAVELTTRCPLRCGMCPIGSLTRPAGDMSPGLLERVASELATAKLRVDWLHELGEPLLYPWLAEAVALFPGCGVSTSGLLLDERRGDRLLEARPARVRIGLDTCDREAYRVIRRGSDFDTVVANVRRFLEQARNFPIDVEIQRLRTKLTRTETAADFVAFFDLGHYPNARVVEKNATGLDTSDPTSIHDGCGGCAVGGPLEWIVVLRDGRVTHCCFDWDGRQTLGDLSRDSLAEILSPAALRDLALRFAAGDFRDLPRCAECHRRTADGFGMARAALGLARRLEARPPVRRAFRALLPERFRRSAEAWATRASRR